MIPTVNHFRIFSLPVLMPWAMVRGAWTGLLLLALLLGCLPGSAHATDAGQPAAAFTHVMVELALPPAAALFAQANAAGQDRATLAVATRAHLTRIDAAQSVVLANLPPDAAVLYQVRNAYNGIAVRVNAGEIAQLAELPGVAAIHPLIPKQPDNVQSVPFTGAPVLWRGLTDSLGDDITGRGMTIAVIDTGVDYLHATFGGVGPYTAAYAENDPTRIGDVPGFPGAKVIGGYDFAGDAYNADPDAADYMPFPQPDQDPMDCYPHGTHVAATAAGYGVLSSGRTDERVYRGPYDPTTYQQNFAIGPGVAPHASIIALKVFGCRGSSDLVELAIDWAIDPNGDGDFSDRVDVINLSLGSSYGAVHDPAAIAANNAALTGIVVVASTGNAGDVVYVTGSPAVADRVISVAAGRVPVPGEIHAALSPDRAEATDNIAAFSSRGPRRDDSSLKPDITAPGVSILSSVPGGSGVRGEAWSGTSMASPHVAGAMALLRQLHPTWSVEELKALVMNSARLASATAMTTASPTRIGAGELDLSQVTANETVAFDADGSGRVSLSFGAPEVQMGFFIDGQVFFFNDTA
ncbi:MAG: S8 family serine peptidase, partial [Caldilineaceae bacterium]|nr:S8 family serine peptidase [Caldilineaceae bacterium]